MGRRYSVSWSQPPATMFIYNQVGGVAGPRRAGLASPKSSSEHRPGERPSAGRGRFCGRADWEVE